MVGNQIVRIRAPMVGNHGCRPSFVYGLRVILMQKHEPRNIPIAPINTINPVKNTLLKNIKRLKQISGPENVFYAESRTARV